MKKLRRGDPEDAKLIVVPSSLVDRLMAVAIRQGVSLSNYAADALEQALRADVMGTSLQETVDMFRLMEIQRGAGSVNISRSSLNLLIEELYPNHGEEMRRAWRESGRWYGEYLHTKLRGEDVLGFFEKTLLVSWNLDEVEIKNEEGFVTLRYASFTMPFQTTELLISFISGVMTSLGYKELDRDYLRGMATLRFGDMRED